MQECVAAGHRYHLVGNPELVCRPLTAFLCSNHVPEGTTEAVRQWVESLDVDRTCCVVGSLGGVEMAALQMLLGRGVRVVLALAVSCPVDISAILLSQAAMQAYAAGRFCVVAPIFDAPVGVATAKSSAMRNELIIAMADYVVVGYMAPNGHLARQLLACHDVKTLYRDTGAQPPRDPQRQRQDAESMGWAIYEKLRGTPLPSIDMRKLLAQYLSLDIPRPSRLHSLILLIAVKRYANDSDFDFTAFVRLWGPENLRPEDWVGKRLDGIWIRSLSDRVISRLFRAMPTRFVMPINPRERFDALQAHLLLDEALRRSPRNKFLWRRALNLAYYEHDGEAIARYCSLLGKNVES